MPGLMPAKASSSAGWRLASRDVSVAGRALSAIAAAMPEGAAYAAAETDSMAATARMESERMKTSPIICGEAIRESCTP
jgi:hypothetical protein